MSSVAASLAVSSAAQTRNALATEFVKQDQQQAANIATLVEQASEALQTVAQSAPAPGLGGVVDITA
ncbi:hypothetical protein HPQ64_04040 [Rhizobiales bacterium]|uniref:hypothetical protein n=1 Tax=Hongsoonwoonella zoysiae TaxID=2821844 RepID=UPI0015619A00|nr:hypothetical protein [Hongsoonwoonella zoysiae]NRG16859.1 hypothetical protein [Hongsoonwoonella zoysiae]